MENYEVINDKLDNIQQMLETHAMLTKVVLNFKEAVAFLGLSEGHVYQLTSTNRIPYYRPNGKKIYFKREELQDWLLRNKQITAEEAEQEAADYFLKKK